MKKASPRIRSMQYFICDMYSEKCFLQIVNLSTGFLTRFLIGGKSFGVGRELEKTYPATCMHWIESVSSYREGLCRGMPPGKILKSGPLRVHFQHSGAKIGVFFWWGCQQNPVCTCMPLWGGQKLVWCSTKASIHCLRNSNTLKSHTYFETRNI